jgi:hypothetical protein
MAYVQQVVAAVCISLADTNKPPIVPLTLRYTTDTEDVGNVILHAIHNATSWGSVLRVALSIPSEVTDGNGDTFAVHTPYKAVDFTGPISDGADIDIYHDPVTPDDLLRCSSWATAPLLLVETDSTQPSVAPASPIQHFDTNAFTPPMSATFRSKGVYDLAPRTLTTLSTPVLGHFNAVCNGVDTQRDCLEEGTLKASLATLQLTTKLYMNKGVVSDNIVLTVGKRTWQRQLALPVWQQQLYTPTKPVAHGTAVPLVNATPTVAGLVLERICKSYLATQRRKAPVQCIHNVVAAAIGAERQYPWMTARVLAALLFTQSGSFPAARALCAETTTAVEGAWVSALTDTGAQTTTQVPQPVQGGRGTSASAKVPAIVVVVPSDDQRVGNLGSEGVPSKPAQFDVVPVFRPDASAAWERVVALLRVIPIGHPFSPSHALILAARGIAHAFLRPRDSTQLSSIKLLVMLKDGSISVNTGADTDVDTDTALFVALLITDKFNTAFRTPFVEHSSAPMRRDPLLTTVGTRQSLECLGTSSTPNLMVGSLADPRVSRADGRVRTLCSLTLDIVGLVTTQPYANTLGGTTRFGDDGTPAEAIHLPDGTFAIRKETYRYEDAMCATYTVCSATDRRTVVSAWAIPPSPSSSNTVPIANRVHMDFVPYFWFNDSHRSTHSGVISRAVDKWPIAIAASAPWLQSLDASPCFGIPKSASSRSTEVVPFMGFWEVTINGQTSHYPTTPSGWETLIQATCSSTRGLVRWFEIRLFNAYCISDTLYVTIAPADTAIPIEVFRGAPGKFATATNTEVGQGNSRDHDGVVVVDNTSIYLPPTSQ